MRENEKKTIVKINGLFNSQSFAVLSTEMNNQPYASLVAFTATKTLEQILFLTPKDTSKYDNINQNPKVAILVHNSINEASDIHNAISVTGIGNAKILSDTDKEQMLDLFIEQHPHLTAFGQLPETALICVTIKQYSLVSHFQNVVIINMEP